MTFLYMSNITLISCLSIWYHASTQYRCLRLWYHIFQGCDIIYYIYDLMISCTTLLVTLSFIMIMWFDIMMDRLDTCQCLPRTYISNIWYHRDAYSVLCNIIHWHAMMLLCFNIWYHCILYIAWHQYAILYWITTLYTLLNRDMPIIKPTAFTNNV